MKMDPKKIEELFKDNKKIILADGDKLIGPGLCPLEISDWINYLSNLWVRYDQGIITAKNWKFSTVILNVTLGTFLLMMISYLINSNDPFFLFILGLIIYGVVAGLSFFAIDFFGKIMENQANSRGAINIIIQSIIAGTLKDTNLIREIYSQTTRLLHIKATKLIKELKLDKQ